MKITKSGLDMSVHVVDMTCMLCSTEYAASADPKTGEAHIYDGGDVPFPGKSRQLRAICTCPNCGAQNQEAVDLRKVSE